MPAKEIKREESPETVSVSSEVVDKYLNLYGRLIRGTLVGIARDPVIAMQVNMLSNFLEDLGQKARMDQVSDQIIEDFRQRTERVKR